MTRPVALFTGPFADLPLEELAPLAAEWGFQGLELCCWGDHLEVQRALSEPEYCPNKLELLRRCELELFVLSNHRVAQAVCDPIDTRHYALVPDYVWGDGNPEGIRERAVEEMIATVRVAHQLGVGVVAGFTGSPIWSYVVGYPAPTAELVAGAFRDFAYCWNPILDMCSNCGVRYAFEVHPGQIAFDLHTAEMALEAVGGREEFGFLFDPGHFHWQGIDPVEFIRRFPDRIFHVHVKDVMVTLNGRNGLLGSYLPYGDPRRGWQPRAPGRGGIDWESIFRALYEIGYEGPLSVEWQDPALERRSGVEQACRFVKQLDFDPAPRDRG